MNWHLIIDERNYEMDQVVASVLKTDPKLLERVVAWIEERLADPDFSIHSKDALQEWLRLIQTGGLNGVVQALSDRSEEASRRRQSSPFAIIMPQDERVRILRKYEARRPGTHPASV